MPITKANLIDSIYNNLDLQKQESRIIIEALLEIIKHTLESGEDVLISGFGKFCVKDKKERKGRNPQTASDMKLRARRVVTFKCSRTLRENLNTKKKRKKS
jgi:integration host factor subunit alpha